MKFLIVIFFLFEQSVMLKLVSAEASRTLGESSRFLGDLDSYFIDPGERPEVSPLIDNSIEDPVGSSALNKISCLFFHCCI